MDPSAILDSVEKYGEEQHQDGWDGGWQAALDAALDAVLKVTETARKAADDYDQAYFDGLDDAAIALREAGARDEEDRED